MGRDRRFIGIGTKISVMVVALVVATSCAVGYSTYRQFNQALVQEKLNELSTLARMASIRCAAAMKTLHDDAVVLSRLPTVAGIVRARESADGVDPDGGWTEEQWRDRLGDAFLGMLQTKPQYCEIRLIGLADGGREIVRVDRLGPDHSVRVAPVAELQQKRERTYFQHALKTPPGQAWLTNIELNRDGPGQSVSTPHEPVVRAATPIYTPDGEPFGMIVVDRMVLPLFEEIRGKLDAGQELRIANERGDYLLHPEPGKAFGFELEEPFKLANEFPQLQPMLVDSAQTSHSAVVESSSTGKIAIGICPVGFDPARPERHLKFAVSAPYAAVVAASDKLRTTSLLTALAVLAPALAIGYALSRSLARPLQQIASATRDFARGETDLLLPINATDEAGVVARSLQGMVGQVRSRTASLELEIAERKRGEATIREQGARMSAIVNGVLDAIITIDAQGKIDSVNRAAERIFGYSAAELVGNNVKMLMPQPYRGEHDQYLRNYLDSGAPQIIGIGREVVGVRKDGSEFPIDLGVTEIVLDGRRLFSGVVRDISDRKHKETELLSANAELRRRASSIERFNKQLARSNDELKQFAYVASHDLQEPLRKVTSFCEMLRDEYRDRLDGDALTYIDYAVNGALRMKSLVNDLLDYSRVETQGKPLEPTSAEDALAEAIANLELAIRESQAVVEHDRLPTIAADRAQLVRLFQNLIGNAIKYRGDAPPHVHVWIEEKDSEWQFHVQDNGLGIDPQYHARIFVIFQRLHSREAYPGTGIGLAVCKRIVERFGGRIWVNSELGSGSDFCFALPKSAINEVQAPQQGQKHASDTERCLVQTY